MSYRFFYLLLAISTLTAVNFSTMAQVAKRPVRNSTAKSQTADSSVIPGVGAGQVRIGDSVERIFQLFPRLKRNELYQSDGCTVGELNVPGSLMLYIQNGTVSQIAVQDNSPKAPLETAEKIKTGSTAEQVKKAYPGANKAFTKLNSAVVSTGYAPLIFWVDENAGIAFEFYTDSAGRRLVDKIHIFQPNGKMFFGGTCETDEDLRELPSFATKVPQKMISDYERQ